MIEAIYPGTFDPITLGHVDLIERAAHVFDRLTILVAHSTKKIPLFSADERKEMIEQCFVGKRNLNVEIHTGLLVDYAKEKNIHTILRGLRVVSDFEYEFQMATINRQMYSKIQTFFLMSSERFFFINSTLVKELCAHRGEISHLVPLHVEKKLKQKLWQS